MRGAHDLGVLSPLAGSYLLIRDFSGAPHRVVGECLARPTAIGQSAQGVAHERSRVVSGIAFLPADVTMAVACGPRP
jgi:hypothetical protein